MNYPDDFVNKLLCGDCVEILKQIPDNTINCCVTSPPYFNLRNYGIDGQIGLEKTPDQYVDKLVTVFKEVRRILREDGTFWLNLGDSFCCSKISSLCGLKPKDLIGIPWKTAFALQDDGWYLRQDIIWEKSNAMPESVKDRCTKSHEYVFLMAKSEKYYFDSDAIKEPSVSYDPKWKDKEKVKTPTNIDGNMSERGVTRTTEGLGKKPAWEKTGEFRNRRSVWSIPTTPYRGSHFAVFPCALVEPCVKAGCPEGGIVLDPFMGAATTAIVTKKLKRNFIGTELNPEYCKLGRKRLDELPQ